MKIKTLLLIMFLLTINLQGYTFTNAEIDWHEIEKAIELSLENPKKIMVYVYSRNCIWCTRMERNTFSNPVISEYLNEKYYPVKLNANIRNEVTLGDKTYRYIAANPAEGTPAYHELVVTLLNGRLAYPAVAFISENLSYMGVEMGYKAPDVMEKILHYIAEDAYLKYPVFEEFAAEFEGKLN